MKRNFLIPQFLLIALLFLTFYYLLDCQQVSSQIKPEDGRQTQNAKNEGYSPEKINVYTMRSGEKITVEETHPVGASLSTVIIKAGAEADKPVMLSDIDPLTKVLVADLDQNGFDEIYLITQSAGSGSYGKVFGFASNRDKSLSAIDTDEINKTDKGTGYRGHDSYSIGNGCLTLEFPEYKENDANAQPAGGVKKLCYSLVSNEAGYQLKIKL